MDDIQILSHVINQIADFPEGEGITLPYEMRQYVQTCLMELKDHKQFGGLPLRDEDDETSSNIINVSREEFLRSITTTNEPA